MTQLTEQILLQTQALQLDLTKDRAEKLARYVDLMLKWNQTINLTAITQPTEVISKHLLDSLSVGSYVIGPSVLDVGTGGGLPGIPLSILFPQYHFTLNDASGKKTRFLQQVVIELGLSNVEVCCGRVEQYPFAQTYDTILSRAFAKVDDMFDKTQHLLGEKGILVAMKGKDPSDELAKIPRGYRLIANQSVEVPGLEAERHVVIIAKE